MTLNISDPMFPDRANLRDRDILVGERPNRMVKALERIFDLSLPNPLVTYISGDVGSGKSHLLNHIQFLSEKNENRLVVVINANQFDSIDALTILRSIHADYTLRQSLRDEMRLSNTALLDRVNLIYEINNGLEILGRRSTKSKDFGLIVGIDSLDEFIRTRMLDTSKLLITIRLLLEDLHKTCFVLSLTHNILEEAKGKYLAEDRTFSRRFIGPQEYDGSPLNFIGFDRGETFEMYNVYRNRWLKRRLDDGEINQEEYDKFEKSEWPISKEAISLAWEATNNKAPYALQSLFQHALNELRTAYDEWFNPDTVIQEQQMAHVIEIAVNRAESGIRVSEEEFEHKINILTNEDRYLIPVNNTEWEYAIALFSKKLIEESGFATEGKRGPKGAYILNVTEPINNESQPLGLFIALNRTITETDITSLNKLVTKELKKINPRYVIVFTNDKNCRGVYDGIGGPKREFTEICHLGNYTYVVQLSDNQIEAICATHKQRDKEYYKALLKIIDKRCCAELGLSLSEILKAIIYATFER
jgi:hypothetical protein